jgi:parvulin-like peptidyl-prolyl isomerase
MRSMFRNAFTGAILAAFTWVASSVAYAELVSGVKAIVHDSIITYQEVELFAAPAIRTAVQQMSGDPQKLSEKVNALRADSLEQLVERQLILHDFKAAGYNLPENYLDESIQERIKSEFGDRKTMIQTLRGRGITPEKYRQQIREQIIIRALRSRHIPSDPIISPAKIEEYYRTHQDTYKLEDQVKLRMIVLNKTGVDDTNTVQLAEEIVTKLKDGADFKEMATVYSSGSQRGEGGDWGWGTRSSLRKELADVAFTLKAGEFSPVIDTPNACFIMLVEESKLAHVRPLSEVRDEIEKNLAIEEQSRLADQYINKLKKKTFIRYF